VPSFLSNQHYEATTSGSAVNNTNNKKEDTSSNYSNSFPNELNRSLYCEYQRPPTLGHASRLDVDMKPVKPVNHFLTPVTTRLGVRSLSISSNGSSLSSKSVSSRSTRANTKSLSGRSGRANTALAATKLFTGALLAASSTSNPPITSPVTPRKSSRRGSDTMHQIKFDSNSVLRPPNPPAPSLAAKTVVKSDHAVVELSEKTRFALPDGRDRYIKTSKGFDRLRAIYRGNKLRLEQRDKKYLSQGLLLQKLARRSLAQKSYKHQLQAIDTIQRSVHVWLQKRWLQRCRRSALRLESISRMLLVRRCYKAIRYTVVFIQAVFRGYQQRRISYDDKKERLTNVRNHLLLLWSIASTPLLHRSAIWMLYCQPTFLHIAACEVEARDLWQQLGLSPKLPPPHHHHPTSSSSSSCWRVPFHLQMPNMILNLEESNLLQVANDINNKKKKNNNKTNNTVTSQHLYLEKAKNNFIEDRKQLYLRLKASQKHTTTTEKGNLNRGSTSFSSLSSTSSSFVAQSFSHDTDELFSKFNLENKKRRKHTLSEMVWTLEADPDASAEVVMGSFENEFSCFSDIVSYWNTFKSSSSSTSSSSLIPVTNISTFSLCSHKTLDKHSRIQYEKELSKFYKICNELKSYHFNQCIKDSCFIVASNTFKLFITEINKPKIENQDKITKTNERLSQMKKFLLENKSSSRKFYFKH
jgi:hypothetical protein